MFFLPQILRNGSKWCPLTLFRMGLLGAAHRLGGAKKPHPRP